MSCLIRRLLPAALLLLAIASAPLMARAQGAQALRCEPRETVEQCYQTAVDLARRALQATTEETARSPVLARALALLRDTCDRGRGEACFMAGQLTLLRAAARAATDSTPFDREAERLAAGFFERGCVEAGQGGACSALGRAYAFGIGRAENPDSAFRVFLRGCDLGDATACFLATSRPVEEAHLAISRLHRTAMRDSLAQLACEGGSPSGCANAAFFLKRKLERLPAHQQRGPRYAADVRRVMELYAWSCGVGDLHACANAGIVHRDGELSYPVNADSARYYLRRGCPPSSSDTLASGYACRLLGYFVLQVERDTVAGLDLLLRGCRLADGDACGAYADEAYAARRRNEAMSSALTGCSERSGFACMIAGWLYEQDAFRDWTQAQAHYERACTLREAAGCTGLADMYVAGRASAPAFPRAAVGGPASAPERANAVNRMMAVKYFRRACDLESGAGCREAGAFLETAYPVSSDPLYYFALACDYGDAEGCWQAMRLSAEARAAADEGVFRSRACALDSEYCKKQFTFARRTPG